LSFLLGLRVGGFLFGRPTLLLGRFRFFRLRGLLARLLLPFPPGFDLFGPLLDFDRRLDANTAAACRGHAREGARAGTAVPAWVPRADAAASGARRGAGAARRARARAEHEVAQEKAGHDNGQRGECPFDDRSLGFHVWRSLWR
jgi:hypothetical protein